MPSAPWESRLRRSGNVFRRWVSVRVHARSALRQRTVGRVTRHQDAVVQIGQHGDGVDALDGHLDHDRGCGRGTVDGSVSIGNYAPLSAGWLLNTIMMMILQQS
jgi:hypothetical protein